MRALLCFSGVLALSMPLLVTAQQPALLPQGLSIKYMRDSQEYATLARQVYRGAEQAIRQAAADLEKGSWVVSLDIDETALDNSTYQLEREAYGLPFEAVSWNAWIARRQARRFQECPSSSRQSVSSADLSHGFRTAMPKPSRRPARTSRHFSCGAIRIGCVCKHRLRRVRRSACAGQR